MMCIRQNQGIVTLSAGFGSKEESVAKNEMYTSRAAITHPSTGTAAHATHKQLHINYSMELLRLLCQFRIERQHPTTVALLWHNEELAWACAAIP